MKVCSKVNKITSGFRLSLLSLLTNGSNEMQIEKVSDMERKYNFWKGLLYA
jgi:hypothetical protein